MTETREGFVIRGRDGTNPQARNLYRHRADPGLNIPLLQMTMTDQAAAASPIGLIGIRGIAFGSGWSR